MNKSLKTGVLTLRGHDQRGTMVHALNYLVECPGDMREENFVPGNITLAHARGFGDFGYVCLRFVTNQSTLEALRSSKRLLALESMLNANGKPGEVPMEALLFPADEQWDIDPVKTHLTFTIAGASKYRHPPNDSLRQTLAILASDKNVDVTSYDSVEDGNSITEGWRIYDLLGRGEGWLDNFVQAAMKLPVGINVHDWKVGKHTPSEFFEFVDATLQRESQGASSGSGWLYCSVHCRDSTGLLAIIDKTIRALPSGDGSLALRSTARTCCVGVGGQAVVLVAVEGLRQEADDLKARLDAVVRQQYQEKPSYSHGQTRAGKFPCVFVTHSTRPPTMIDHSAEERLLAVHFVSTRDEPGLLQRVCEAAANVEGGKPGIYYLGARQRQPNQLRSTSFACAIGWIASKSALNQLQRNVDAIIGPLSPKNEPPQWKRGG